MPGDGGVAHAGAKLHGVDLPVEGKQIRVDAVDGDGAAQTALNRIRHPLHPHAARLAHRHAAQPERHRLHARTHRQQCNPLTTSSSAAAAAGLGRSAAGGGGTARRRISASSSSVMSSCPACAGGRRSSLFGTRNHIADLARISCVLHGVSNGAARAAVTGAGCSSPRVLSTGTDCHAQVTCGALSASIWADRSLVVAVVCVLGRRAPPSRECRRASVKLHPLWQHDCIDCFLEQSCAIFGMAAK